MTDLSDASDAVAARMARFAWGDKMLEWLRFAPPPCSFCCELQHEVRTMAGAAPSTFICNKCVDLCSRVFAERAKNASTKSAFGNGGNKPTTFADIVSYSLAAMPLMTFDDWARNTPEGRLVAAAKGMKNEKLFLWLMDAPMDGAS